DDYDETDGFAQFNFFGRGSASTGITNVDQFWFGAYSSYYTYETPNADSYNWGKPSEAVFYTTENCGTEGGSYDSAASWSWQNRTIAAGETQTYSVLIGIGGVGSENIVDSGGDIDDYNPGSPSESYSLIVSPTDPHKEYAVQIKESGGDWTTVIDLTPSVTGTVDSTNRPASASASQIEAGWWRSDADPETDPLPSMTFAGIPAGTQARILERVVTQEGGQTAAAGSITVDTVLEYEYALFSNTGESGWTQVTGISIGGDSNPKVAAAESQDAVETGTDPDWFKNSAASGGKLTFTYTPAENTSYEVRHRTSGGGDTPATNSLSVTVAEDKQYALHEKTGEDIWVLVTNIDPIGEGVAEVDGTNWFTATPGKVLTWSGLDPAKSYRIDSTTASNPLTELFTPPKFAPGGGGGDILTRSDDE
ncbi:MAG: hypothetical protein Q4C22_07095, partial [Bacillota bacterium]|nr:hypothetical protein [Bacillota bacterium]